MTADGNSCVTKVEPVLAAERAHLRRIRPWRFADEGANGPILFGLALSGGGIRSAAFALGAMHALVRYDKLRWFDFLSTVSGGGYAGSALTWMLSTYDGADARRNTSESLGAFPLSAARQGRRTSASNPSPDFNKPPIRRLDWIRARGNFLAPTDELSFRADRMPPGGVPGPRMPSGGLSVFSVVGVVLRSVIVGLAVYLPALFAAMTLVGAVVEDLAPRLGDVFSFFGAPAPRWTIPISDRAWAKVFAAIALFALAVFAGSSIAYALFTRLAGRSAYPMRTWVQWVGGWLLNVALLGAALATLPFATAWAETAWLGSSLTLGGIASGALHLLLRGRPGSKTELSLGAIATLGGLALCYGLLLLGYIFAHAVLGLEGRVDVAGAGPGWLADSPTRTFFLLLAWSALMGIVMNLNYVTPHRMYRDRLMEAFMPQPPRPRSGFERATADTAPLADMCGAGQGAGRYPGPYHLINANVVLTRSDFEGTRGRGGDAFVLSPLWCGSAATGWYATSGYGAATRLASNRRTMTLATAMSVSGAAANPHTGASGQGPMRIWPIAFLMNLLHLRLGYVEINPARVDALGRGMKRWLLPARPNPWIPGLPHLFGRQHHERAHFVELSDGGHFENLGLYELLRREVRVIVCTDAGCDPDFAFADLATSIERARVDFGLTIRFLGSRGVADLVTPPLQPGQNPFTAAAAKRGFAIAQLRYAPCRREPANANEPVEEQPPGTHRLGILIYIKSTMTEGLPADLYGYRGAHPVFPHESTSDQFFDEPQFESYRELGYRLTSQALNDDPVRKVFGGDGEDPPAAARNGDDAIALATYG